MSETVGAKRITVLLTGDGAGHGVSDAVRKTYRKFFREHTQHHSEIVIIAIPLQPSSNWNCGTDFIWQVCPEWLRRRSPEIDSPDWRFVCRHQIQIGD